MADTFDVGKAIIEGAQEIFSTMLMVDLESDEVVYNKRIDIQSNLSSMIGLGNGIRGTLAIHCPASVAKAITGGFLGMEIDELGDDVKDAIGEIANMVAGNLKISYAAVGIDIELAIPTSIIGESYNLGGSGSAQRVIVPLMMSGEKFWIELLYLLG